MTWDPAQLVTLALAVVGAFGTATKAAEKIAPAWIKWRQRRDRSEKSEREETQKTFEQLGTWKERARALRDELTRRDERIDELEGEIEKRDATIEKQAARIDELEARVKHLERLVLDMIGPPAPQDPQASNVAELGRRRR